MKNLVKVTTCLVIAVFLFSSCHKEGQYLPKKKISKIEHITTSTLWGITTTAVSGYQEWEWSGKLLTRITLRNGDGVVNGSIVPQYDNKKRVQSLHCVSGTEVHDYNFTYDGKNLMKITHYSSAKDASEYTFTKDGKNVVEITVTSLSSKSCDDAGINPLQFVLPTEIAEVIKPSAEKGTTIYKLVWDGQNVTGMEEVRNGVVYANYSWTYDNGLNPLKGLFSNGYGSLNGFEELYSDNNIVEASSVTHLSFADIEQSEQYSYEYDNNYPVRKTWETLSSTGLDVVHTQNYLYN